MTSVDLWEHTITDIDDIEPQYMFHRTTKSNMRAILSSGFNPNSAKRSNKTDEQFLKAVADEQNAYFPVDRRDSSFFYPHYSQVRRTFGGHLGTGLIVVDSRKVPQNTYVADMELYDSVISHSPQGSSKIERRQFTNKQRNVARSYLKSIKQIQKVTESTGKNLENPEVMVDGNGPSRSAIVGVILDDI